jgi:hypothetical protein
MHSAQFLFLYGGTYSEHFFKDAGRLATALLSLPAVQFRISFSISVSFHLLDDQDNNVRSAL